MAISNERTSLLLHTSVNGGPSNNNPEIIGVDPVDEEEEDEDSEIDDRDDTADAEILEQSLNTLSLKFGSSMGSFSLDGNMQGGLFRRRGSIAYLPSNVVVQVHRRPSHPEIASDLLSQNEYRHKTISERHVISIPVPVEENDEVPSKFLGGVSEARFWAIFAGIMLVQFVACFDSTLMASSHPIITSYFHSSNSASWLSTSFLLTSTAFQPLFGRVSDTFGRRGPFVFSLAVFALGTAWCAAAQSILSFIMARAMCGIGAGGAMSMGAIVNSDLVPIEIRGTYQSILNLAFGFGSSLGAAMGGFLADALGWRWEFAIQVPPIVLCLVIAWVATPDDLGPHLSRHSDVTVWQTLKSFDLAGSFLLTMSVTFLILALNLGGNVLPWSHPFIVIAFLIFVITAGILVQVESKAEKAVMPLKFMFSSPQANLVFSNFFASIAANTVLFNLPLYFQAVLLDSATRSGTRLILPFLFNMLAGFATGFIITWSARLKPTLVLGYLLMVIGCILLSLMHKGLPTWAYTQFIIPSSLGQGFAFPSVTLSILAASHQQDMAVATSVLILWRSLGTVMGVAFSSLIVQNTLIYYLEQFVTGHHKESIISSVRKSVEAIGTLAPTAQDQVIDAYSAALRLTFISSVAAALLALLIVIPIRLPRLGRAFVTVVGGGE